MKIETVDTLNRPDPRRRRLLLALPSSLALASPLALVACGGGGDSGGDAGTSGGTGLSEADQAAIAAIVAKLPPAERSAQAVKVALPAGQAIALADTHLVSANNVSQVAADGTAGVVLISGAPQMSYLFDGAGRLLLMSVIEAGVRTTVDSRGTAEALLLLTSEAAYQGPAVEIALRRALADAAVVEPVRLAVEGALGRGGIDASDTALINALDTATATMRAGTTAAPAGSGRLRPQSVSALPAGPQSGVTVVSTDDFNTVTLKNQYRRRTHAWLARTGYFDDTGTPVALPAPVPLTDFALDATTPLSFDNLVIAVGDLVAELAESIGFLGDYEAGNASWQPVTSSPVQLPIAPDTAEVAVYGARVVGIGASDGGTLTADEAKALDDILGATLWEDILQPFVRTLVLPMISERLGTSYGEGAQQFGAQMLINGLADLSSIVVAGTYFPATVAALRAGDAKGAIAQFMTEFFNSNTFLALLDRCLHAFVSAAGTTLNPVVQDGNGTPVGVNLPTTTAAENVEKLKGALGKLARIIQVVKLATLVGDYGALAKDWLASTRVAEFTLNVSKAKVKLSPKPLVVTALTGAAGKGTVTATVDDLDTALPAANVFLEWSCTGKWGHLYKRGGNDLDHFESVLTDPSHDYIASGSEADPADPDSISVTAFYRNPTTNARIELGTATVPVEIRDEFNLTLLPMAQDVPADGDFSLTAFIKERLPTGATVEWTWSHGGVGSLADAPADANLQDSAVVFHAGSAEGSATVTASAVVHLPATAGAVARTATVKPATAKLTVKKGLKTVTVTGSWTTDYFYEPYTCAQCGPGGTPKELIGYSAIAFAVVPKVAGFTSCSVVLKSSDPYIAKNRGFGPDVFVGRDTGHGEQDRGGAVWLGLSGASGTVGDNGEGPDGAAAYFAGRFADLVVTATYTLS